MRSNLQQAHLFKTRWDSGGWSSSRKVLSGSFTIIAGSSPVYFLDADGANRNVNLPTNEEGLVFFILNVGGAGDLQIRSSLGVLLSTVTPDNGVGVFSSDDEWGLVVGGGAGSPGAAYPIVRTVTAAGAITVDVSNDDHILVNKTVGAATTVNLPASAGRTEGRHYKVADKKGDADTNPITIVPNGVETIAGLTSWVIDLQKGSVTFWPDPDGTGWYV